LIIDLKEKLSPTKRHLMKRCLLKGHLSNINKGMSHLICTQDVHWDKRRKPHIWGSHNKVSTKVSWGIYLGLFYWCVSSCSISLEEQGFARKYLYYLQIWHKILLEKGCWVFPLLGFSQGIYCISCAWWFLFVFVAS
jgi:hypothetical protein